MDLSIPANRCFPLNRRAARQSGGRSARRICSIACLLSLCLIVAGTPRPTRADDGWSLSSLNPFSSKPSPAKSRSASQRKAPSTWDNFTQGTSQFMGKTKEVLMPWSKPAKPARAGFSSKSRTTNARRVANKPEEKSWYEFWKSEPEEPQRPKTVQDFLAQPRPE